MLHADLKKIMNTEHGSEELHVQLSVSPGECVGIKGVTGAGKTTLLNMISGMLDPDNGAVTFNNSVWWQKSPKKKIPMRKRNIGYCMQRGVIYNHMTVKKNILFGGASSDFAEELLEKICLYAFKDSFPHTLSGGQRQRLLLARTFAKKHSLFLLDEPFSALDTKTAWYMADIIKNIQSLYKTPVILVSHNDGLLSALSDRVLTIQNGRLYEKSSPQTTPLSCSGMLRVIDLSKKRKSFSA